VLKTKKSNSQDIVRVVFEGHSL